MKKTAKPAAKKRAAKKPTAKKSSTRPKRKTESRSELAGLIDRLAAVTEQLTDAAKRFAVVTPPLEVRTEEVIIESDAPGEQGPNVADASDEEEGRGLSDDE